MKELTESLIGVGITPEKAVAIAIALEERFSKLENGQERLNNKLNIVISLMLLLIALALNLSFR